MPQQFISPADLINRQIPPEILDQLQVLGRIQFKPEDTTPSAVSTTGTTPDTTVADNLSGVLSHVAEMEGLSKQIEDMIDQLTKDMAIPVDPNNSTLKAAVQSLSPTGDGSTITKDIFDTAMALIDHASILTMGYDPFLAALTGDGSLKGSYLNCSDVTRDIAKTWEVAKSAPSSPSQPIADQTAKIEDNYAKQLAQMVIEILQNFFFNMLWPKYMVDLSIINPIRLMIANPLDSIICFFKNLKRGCGDRAGAFTVKSPDCLKLNGPVNKALTKFRCFLLCIPPRKLWDPTKYKPMVDISHCHCVDLQPCPPAPAPVNPGVDRDSKLGGMSNLMDSLFDASVPTCSDTLSGVPSQNAAGLGVPPQCLQNATTVVNAVVADALSPTDPTRSPGPAYGTINSPAPVSTPIPSVTEQTENIPVSNPVPVTGSTAVSNYRYWGASTQTTYDAPTTTGLYYKTISNVITNNFTITVGVGEYIVYAYPSRLGDANIAINGAPGIFDAPTSLSITNTNAYTENYYVYKSTSSNLGTVNMEVA